MSILTDKPVGAVIAEVKTRDDVVAVIRKLRCELRDNPHEWVNLTLDSYLEAMAAWIDDSDGYYDNASQAIPRTASWRTLADILTAAKTYE